MTHGLASTETIHRRARILEHVRLLGVVRWIDVTGFWGASSDRHGKHDDLNALRHAGDQDDECLGRFVRAHPEARFAHCPAGCESFRAVPNHVRHAIATRRTRAMGDM